MDSPTNRPTSPSFSVLPSTPYQDLSRLCGRILASANSNFRVRQFILARLQLSAAYVLRLSNSAIDPATPLFEVAMERLPGRALDPVGSRNMTHSDVLAAYVRFFLTEHNVDENVVHKYFLPCLERFRDYPRYEKVETIKTFVVFSRLDLPCQADPSGSALPEILCGRDPKLAKRILVGLCEEVDFWATELPQNLSRPLLEKLPVTERHDILVAAAGHNAEDLHEDFLFRRQRIEACVRIAEVLKKQGVDLASTKSTVPAVHTRKKRGKNATSVAVLCFYRLGVILHSEILLN